ncbi:MAG TPA: OmpA family protein [Bacteroidia bacterium]|jgi:peptidoglycan-associated lipoprotein
MKKLIPLLFLCFIAITGSFAQRNFYREAEKKFAQKEFYSAIAPYKKAYEKAPKKLKPEILFRIGMCYRNINEPKQAEAYFSKCIKAHYDQTDPEAILFYADAMKMQERYADALVQYEKYHAQVPSDPRGEDGVKSCQLAVKWKQEPTRYVVENMVQINTASWDYAPSYADRKYKTLIISSTRNGVNGDDPDNNVGQMFADLFTTQIDNKGKWSTPTPLSSPINTKVNEAADVINKKSNVMYFTRCGVEKNIDVKCKLFISIKKGNNWNEPSVLPFCVDSFNFGHPALAPDENMLIFSSDMAGGQGGLDLWYSVYDKKNNSWSPPVNLGPSVNTPGDEAFPYVHDDGTLYFASTGHLGMGGYDIFRAGKLKDGQWNKPENMRAPINSAGDDFGIIFEGKKERGYFTSNRLGGKGGDDIYSFSLPIIDVCVEGYIKEVHSQKPIKDATVKLLGSEGENLFVKTDSTGYYRFKLSQESSYLLNANGLDIRTKDAERGYIGNPKVKLTTIGITKSTCFKQDMELELIPPVFQMPMILYKTNGWLLDHESNPKDSLEFLYRVLTENPNITIELASHTDYRMPTEYNDTLSLKRARSCVEYLISRGIAPDRMVARGYGERKPLTLNKDVTLPSGKIIPKGSVLTESFINKYKVKKGDWELLLQLDRRTEFSVLRKDYVPHESNGQQNELNIQLDEDNKSTDENKDDPK